MLPTCLFGLTITTFLIASCITTMKIIVIKKIANKEFRKEIGIVFQDPNNQIIFPKVYDNLAFVLNNSSMYSSH